jgi:chromosome partitioning protein
MSLSPDRPVVLAVVNHKGGVGKTTTTVNLAAALADLGHRVLVVDLDPQGSTTRWLVPEDAAPDFGDRPFRVLEGTLSASEAIVPTPHGVGLLPAAVALRHAARTLAGEPASDASLRTALRALPNDAYDVVLIDCPPHEGFLSANALLAATGLLIPVETRVLALQGLASMVAKIRSLAARLDREIPIAAVLACRLDRRTAHAPWVAETIRAFLNDQFPGVPLVEIRENVALSDAAAARQPITRYRPGATGAEDYRALAQVVSTLLEPRLSSSVR